MDVLRLAPAAGSRLAVIGGCGGIGTALIEAALASGLEVVNLDLAVSIAQRPAFVGEWQIACDGSNSAELGAAFTQVEARWGAIDAFVHLAGYTPAPRALGDVDQAMWDELMNVNLRSVYLSVGVALPLLAKGNDPAIVLTSSGLSVTSDKGTGPYAAAKAAINSLTRTLARENAPGLRVNAVAPGPVETAFLSGGTGRGGVANNKDGWFEKGRAVIEATIPLGHVGKPDEIVGPMLFLLGPAARYMTGQILYVNGGRLMH